MSSPLGEADRDARRKPDRASEGGVRAGELLAVAAPIVEEAADRVLVVSGAHGEVVLEVLAEESLQRERALVVVRGARGDLPGKVFQVPRIVVGQLHVPAQLRCDADRATFLELRRLHSWPDRRHLVGEPLRPIRDR